MKIVLTSRAVFPYHGFGGMEKYVYYLARALTENGAEVEVVTRSVKEIHPCQKEVDGFLCTFLPPPAEKTFPPLNKVDLLGFNYLRFCENLRKYLRRARFDLLHSMGITSYFYLKEKERKFVIVQAFGNEIMKIPGLKGKIIRNLPIARALKYCMEKCDAIASEGPFQTQEIIDLFGVKREKIFELPDGIRYDFIQKQVRNPKIKREEIGFKKDDLVLITVNRLTKDKKVDLVVRAFNEISKSIPNAKLIVVGSGPEEASIKKLVQKFGLTKVFRLFKDVDEDFLFSLYAIADIYINASIQKVLLMSVLEAAAAGLPIVSVDSQEGVVVDRKSGIIVKPKSYESLAKGVLKLYQDKELIKLKKESSKIASNYDWNLIARKALKKYEEFMAGA